MSKSRYANTAVIGSHHYATFALPVFARGLRGRDLFENVRTFEYTIQAGDRADHLAGKYLNEEQYWWVICLGNNIIYPFSSGGFKPGRTIRIPYDVKDVLDKFLS